MDVLNLNNLDQIQHNTEPSYITEQTDGFDLRVIGIFVPKTHPDFKTCATFIDKTTSRKKRKKE